MCVYTVETVHVLLFTAVVRACLVDKSTTCVFVAALLKCTTVYFTLPKCLALYTVCTQCGRRLSVKLSVCQCVAIALAQKRYDMSTSIRLGHVQNSAVKSLLHVTIN